jgi:hypothetical protein
MAIYDVQCIVGLLWLEITDFAKSKECLESETHLLETFVESKDHSDIIHFLVSSACWNTRDHSAFWH